MRSRISSILIIAFSALFFGVGGHAAMTSILHRVQLQQLTGIIETAVRRVETTIDNGAAMLVDLSRAQELSCEPSRLQALRLQVYQRSGVKDIRLTKHDGTVLCSAYSETLEFDTARIDRSDMQPSADGRTLVFRVEQIGGEAVGILFDLNKTSSIQAILGVTPSLLDIMPTELRSDSAVRLMLTNGQQVESYISQAFAKSDNDLEVNASSAKFPLSITVAVSQSALDGWNRESLTPFTLLSGGLGFIIGVLLTKAFAKSRSDLAELDRALKRKEFKPFYQPTFDLATRDILGCEVLSRWIKPDGRIIPPVQFIPLAESSGRIEALTWLVMTTALEDLATAMKANKNFKVSFNVVPEHLLNDDFVSTLRDVVRRAKVSPRQIMIEVTERQEFRDLERAKSIVSSLRDYGFKIALDDVGVGHSGLSQIKALGVNTIKIDKFFVDSITTDASAVTIVEMLVRLAHQLEMTVIAEGIEKDEQLSALQRSGVAMGQGYLVARPMPMIEFDAFLRHSPDASNVMSDDVSLVA